MKSREFRDTINQLISGKNDEWFIFGNWQCEENELQQTDLQFLSEQIYTFQPQVLGLANLGLNDEQVSFVTMKLQNNHSIHTLYLPFNALGDRGAIAIAELLNANSHLSTLILFCNIINYQGICALANTLLTNTTLTKLELFSNIIMSEDTNLFRLVLNSNTHLDTLILSPPLGGESLPNDMQARLDGNKKQNKTNKLLKLSLFASQQNKVITATHQGIAHRPLITRH